MGAYSVEKGSDPFILTHLSQIIYETNQRPAQLQHAPWLARIEQQLEEAASLMDGWADSWRDSGCTWMFGDDISQADISIAIAWRFGQHLERVRLDASDYPALAEFSAMAESLPEFRACPLTA